MESGDFTEIRRHHFKTPISSDDRGKLVGRLAWEKAKEYFEARENVR